MLNSAKFAYTELLIELKLTTRSNDTYRDV